jgi:hypothetical protein
MWLVLVGSIAAVWCVGFVVFGPAVYVGPVKGRQLYEKYKRFYEQTHPDQSGLPARLWLGWYVEMLGLVWDTVGQNWCRYLANTALCAVFLVLVCVSLLWWFDDGETQDNAQRVLDTLAKVLPFIVVLYACHISGVVTRLERKWGDRRD